LKAKWITAQKAGILTPKRLGAWPQTYRREMNAKKLARQSEERERNKHRQRLQQLTPGGPRVGNLAVDAQVAKAEADRVQSMLLNTRTIKERLFHRMQAETDRERRARNSNRPPSKLLPYKSGPAPHKKPPPSSSGGRNAHALLQEEMNDFAEYVCLTDRETQMRETVLKDITDAVLSKWPKASVNIFGSFPNGLSIYSSDVDISIQNLGVDLCFGEDGFVPPEEAGTASAAPHSPRETSSSESTTLAVDVTSLGSASLTMTDDGAALDEDDEEVTWSIDNKPLLPEQDESKKRKREEECNDEGIKDEEGEQDNIYEGIEEDDLDSSSDLELNLESGPSSPSATTGPLDAKSKKKLSNFEEEKKMRVLVLLKSLSAHLQTMGWCVEMQVRAKARIPIIALKHRCGLSVDISLGVAAQDHCTAVSQLVYSCGFDNFFPLCSLLKVFLAQLDLDKPFSGGIGSFKLYALVAATFAQYHQNRCVLKQDAARGSHHVWTCENPFCNENKYKPNLAEILCLFFSHWGISKNLNDTTVVNVALPVTPEIPHDISTQNPTLEVTFEPVFRVRDLQETFRLAGNILKSNLDNFAKTQQATSSMIGRILNMDKLATERKKHTQAANSCPPYSVQGKLRVANEILVQLQNYAHFPNPLSIEKLRVCNPALVARLLSYSDVREALGHMMSRGNGNGNGNGSSNKQQSGGRTVTFFGVGGVVGADIMKTHTQKLGVKKG